MCAGLHLNDLIANIARFLHRFKWFRMLAINLISRLESGEFYSKSLRELELDYYGVEVGQYSYGYLQNNPNFPRGTKIGRFCSLAGELKIFRRNHPSKRVSTHPFFYNAKLGLVDKDNIINECDNPLTIGNDVWIGHRVTLLPNCKSIGNGAVIGACAVVTKDIPAYAIVAGSPAEVKGYRFSSDIIKLLQESEWWRLSMQDLGPVFDLFLADLDIETARKLREFCKMRHG